MEAFDKLLKKMGSVCADLENSYFNVVKAWSTNYLSIGFSLLSIDLENR